MIGLIGLPDFRCLQKDAQLPVHPAQISVHSGFQENSAGDPVLDFDDGFLSTGPTAFLRPSGITYIRCDITT
jgi:hypothetical protein